MSIDDRGPLPNPVARLPSLEAELRTAVSKFRTAEDKVLDAIEARDKRVSEAATRILKGHQGGALAEDQDVRVAEAHLRAAEAKRDIAKESVDAVHWDMGATLRLLGMPSR